ncbi:FecCD family ABC transporter permease [Glycomyces dulcitolivorans]|uniref:FecCD family ABC transporter permease n=1 Tax=Glycomyces dulcitolivorans TaxID=2200759 RepID=UPI000DD31B9C|nr:iron chelate uptake ABC transporter family permease subunit [Glycomyces dulcitolivorans]
MRRHLVLRVGGRASTRTLLRAFAVTAALAVLTVLAAVIALGLGEMRISAVDVVRALVSDAGTAIETVVVQWRLPRVLLGVVFGAALGLSGAVFQSLTRNPLGSPDVIGFDSGAYTGAVVSIIAVGSTALVIPSALAGGIATALAVYLLAYRRGVHGFRLIVVGIAVTALLGSVNTYLLLKARLWQAQMASVWGAGSLNGLDWSDARNGTLVVLALLVPLLWLGRRLRMLELGDDAAAAMGVAVEPVRLALVVVGVSLSAVVTALAGPIPFVALVAPQLARRITRAPGVQLVPAAVTGAFLLVTCDMVALNVPPQALPVGLMTIILGGAYLVWLLVAQSRKELR